MCVGSDASAEVRKGMCVGRHCGDKWNVCWKGTNSIGPEKNVCWKVVTYVGLKRNVCWKSRK